MSVAVGFQTRLDAAIDETLTVLEESSAAGVELDPLATILARVQARGQELNLDEMPPLMRMILGGLA